MKDLQKFGKYAYMIGLGVALIVGLLAAFTSMSYADNQWVVVGLIVAGVVIGLANISNSESVPFMIAVLVLALAPTLATAIPYLGAGFVKVMSALSMVLLPAAIVVAAMTAFNKAKN